MTGSAGFIVPTDTPGFSANEIHQKLSLRASVTSELVLDDVRLPADAVLPGVVGLKGPLSCLNEARFGILFGAVGAARACFEAALDYAGERKMFGKPIAGFQLIQRQLAEMATAVNAGMLMAFQIGRLKDAGDIDPAHISMGKFNNVRMAPRSGPHRPFGAGRQRHHTGVPGDPAHEQPRVGVHLRGHPRDPHADHRTGAHRPRRLLE